MTPPRVLIRYSHLAAILALLLTGSVFILNDFFDIPDQAFDCRADLDQSPEAYRRNLAAGYGFREKLDLLNARSRFQDAACAQERPVATIPLAQTLADIGDPQRAWKVAERARAKRHSPQEGLWLEAQIATAAGARHKAVELYASLREQEPENIEITLALARAQIAAHEPKASLETLEKASSRKDPRLALLQANAYSVLGDYENQRRAASLAMAAGEQRPFVAAKGFLFHATALADLNRPQEAFRDFREAAKLAAGNPLLMSEIYREQGALHINLGDYQAALKIYKEGPSSLELKNQGALTGAVTLSMNLGIVHESLGNLTRARRNLEWASRESSAEPSAQRADIADNLGLVLMNQGHLEAAHEAMSQAIGENRELGRAPDELMGLCNLVLIDHLRLDASSLEPTLGRCKDLAARLHDDALKSTALIVEGGFDLWQGDLDRALENSREALRLGREIGERHTVADGDLILATILLEKGLTAEAQRAAQEALQYFQQEKLPDDTALARVLLAEIDLARGELAAARKESAIAEQRAAASEHLELRVHSALTAARIADADKSPSDAFGAAEESLSEAQRFMHPAFELEAGLALGELDLKYPDVREPDRGCNRLRGVEEKARGVYELVARKAAKLRADARPPCPEPP